MSLNYQITVRRTVSREKTFSILMPNSDDIARRVSDKVTDLLTGLTAGSSLEVRCIATTQLVEEVEV